MDVEIRTLEPQKTMFIHRVVSGTELGQAFMDSMPKVGAYVGKKAAGHPFGRYRHFSPEEVDVEIGVPVEALDKSGDIEPGEIPGGRYAMTVQRGPYDTLS